MSNSSSVVKQNFILRLARDYSPLVLIMVAVFIAIFVIGAATAPNFLTKQATKWQKLPRKFNEVLSIMRIIFN